MLRVDTDVGTGEVAMEAAMAQETNSAGAHPWWQAPVGSALMLVGGLVALVSFFLPWVVATPLHPAPGQASFATNPWTLLEMGGVDLVFILLLAGEALIALTGALELARRHGPLGPAGAALLCVPALLATLFVGWITLISANLTAPYLVATSIGIGPWLTILSLLAALAGGVMASTGDGTGATPAPSS